MVNKTKAKKLQKLGDKQSREEITMNEVIIIGKIAGLMETQNANPNRMYPAVIIQDNRQTLGDAAINKCTNAVILQPQGKNRPTATSLAEEWEEPNHIDDDTNVGGKL